MHNVSKFFVLALVSILNFMSSFVFAQDDVSTWYYDKPIKEIKFDGLNKVKKSELDGVIAGFIGKKFSDDVYYDLLNKIYALEFFEDISSSALPYDSKNSSVSLKFQVSERPYISEIKFTGNRGGHLANLKNTILIKKDDIFIESKVKDDENALRKFYLSKGYTNIRVSAKYTKSNDNVVVEFVIDEGKLTTVKSINFQGNSIVSSKTLKKQLKLKEAGLFSKGAFQESTLEYDKQNILSYYQSNGYIDAKIIDIARDFEEADKNENLVNITFVISEGEQYTYGGLTITGNTLFSTEELLSLFKLTEGKVFNATKFNEGLYKIQELYSKDGYTTNGYFPDGQVDIEKKQLYYSLTIVERPRSHIENIIINGLSKTKEEVVLRELPFKPGDIFSQDKLISGLRNVMNLQFFSAVVPDFTAGSEDELINIAINLEEQNTKNIELGTAFSPALDQGEVPISFSLGLSDANFMGTGKSLSAKIAFAQTDLTISAGYTDRWFLGKPVTFSSSLSYNRGSYTALQRVYLPSGINETDYYMNYLQHSFSFDTSIGRRWNKKIGVFSLAGGVSLGIQRNSYDDIFEPVDESLLENVNKWGISNSVYAVTALDARDLSYNPSKGWYLKERLSWTGLIPSIENQYFLRSDTKAEGYLTLLDKPITEKWNLKFVFAGYAGLSVLVPGVNESILPSNKLYVDGIINGRGWNDVYKQKGEAMLNASLELQMPVFPNIITADFYFDAIALKPTLNDLGSLSLNDFYFSFGPGAKIVVPQFPLHFLFANCFRVQDGNVIWKNGKGPDFKFVLSFNTNF